MYACKKSTTISVHTVASVLQLSGWTDRHMDSLIINHCLVLLEKETRPVEPPSSPREAWVPQREAAPPSPSQPISEQLQTSSNLGNRIPLASMFPSTRHLVKPLNPPITSMSKVMSSSTPNLSEERTAQNQQTISTINTSELSPTYSSDQRFMTTTAVRRSDFEAQVGMYANSDSFIYCNPPLFLPFCYPSICPDPSIHLLNQVIMYPSHRTSTCPFIHLFHSCGI